MRVYYNDNDPAVAQWCRNLIAAGLLPEGDVDERSIADVTAADLRGYAQCHFFVGIGGWPLALSLAGWGDRPVWTGSCPCQPFSVAGKGKAQKDSRHLWPEWFRLIRECRPEHVFGEQVAGAIGWGWLDGISTDLEKEGYAVGSAVLGAHSVGAPHVRQRLYWAGRLGNANEQRCQGYGWPAASCERPVGAPSDSRLDNAKSDGALDREGRSFAVGHRSHDGVPGPSGPWSDFVLVACADGKTRRISAEPRDGPLAAGVPKRVVKLRGYGNALCVPTAAEFVSAYLEAA